MRIPLLLEILTVPPDAAAPLSGAQVFPSLAVPHPLALFARTNVSARRTVGEADAALVVQTACSEIGNAIGEMISAIRSTRNGRPPRRLGCWFWKLRGRN